MMKIFDEESFNFENRFETAVELDRLMDFLEENKEEDFGISYFGSSYRINKINKDRGTFRVEPGFLWTTSPCFAGRVHNEGEHSIIALEMAPPFGVDIFLYIVFLLLFFFFILISRDIYDLIFLVFFAGVVSSNINTKVTISRKLFEGFGRLIESLSTE